MRAYRMGSKGTQCVLFTVYRSGVPRTWRRGAFRDGLQVRQPRGALLYDDTCAVRVDLRGARHAAPTENPSSTVGALHVLLARHVPFGARLEHVQDYARAKCCLTVGTGAIHSGCQPHSAVLACADSQPPANALTCPDAQETLRTSHTWPHVGV